MINYNSMVDELVKIKEAGAGELLAGVGGALRAGGKSIARMAPQALEGGMAGLKAAPGRLATAAKGGFQAAKAAPTLGNKLIGGGALAAGGLATGAAAKSVLSPSQGR